MYVSPIVLFVYNRPDHTLQTINALKNNFLASESELYVFSDAAKYESEQENVNKVREIIYAAKGFKKVTIAEREQNWGLAKSIIDGVTTVIENSEMVVVLEDDIICSPYFLTYMNATLNLYQNVNGIGSVSGYSFLNKSEFPDDYIHDVYYSYRHSSWGWGTWKNIWKQIDWSVSDFDNFKKSFKKQKRFNRGGDDLSDMLKKQMMGEINSWSIRFDYYCSKHDYLCVLPKYSLVKNIGFDGSGIHCETSDLYDIELDFFYGKNLNVNDIYLDSSVIKAIADKFKLGFLHNVKQRFWRIYKLIK